MRVKMKIDIMQLVWAACLAALMFVFLLLCAVIVAGALYLVVTSFRWLGAHPWSILAVCYVIATACIYKYLK